MIAIHNGLDLGIYLTNSELTQIKTTSLSSKLELTNPPYLICNSSTVFTSYLPIDNDPLGITVYSTTLQNDCGGENYLINVFLNPFGHGLVQKEGFAFTTYGRRNNVKVYNLDHLIGIENLMKKFHEIN